MAHFAQPSRIGFQICELWKFVKEKGRASANLSLPPEVRLSYRFLRDFVITRAFFGGKIRLLPLDDICQHSVVLML